jgi:hypothetical protein
MAVAATAAAARVWDATSLEPLVYFKYVHLFSIAFHYYLQVLIFLYTQDVTMTAPLFFFEEKIKEFKLKTKPQPPQYARSDRVDVRVRVSGRRWCISSLMSLG